jgi:hypothetical protein
METGDVERETEMWDWRDDSKFVGDPDGGGFLSIKT